MVSHAVSHTIITTTVNNDLDIRSDISFHNITSKLLCDIFSSIQVLHHASLGTCTQCVPVALLANGDLFDRSDRASNTSFVCWQSNVRSYQCKKKSYFSQFQKRPILFASQEVLSIDLLLQAISKHLPFAEFKESAPWHFSALSQDKSVLRVRGR